MAFSFSFFSHHVSRYPDAYRWVRDVHLLRYAGGSFYSGFWMIWLERWAHVNVNMHLYHVLTAFEWRSAFTANT